MPAMSVEDAKAFFDGADDEAKSWLATAVFYQELESIRRPKPLLNSNVVDQVGLFDRDQAQAAGGVGLRGGSARSALPRLPPMLLKRASTLPHIPVYLSRLLAKAASVYVLSDDDDDDEEEDDGDNDGATGGSARNPPGPLTGTSLDLTAVRTTLGYTLPFEQQFPLEVEAAGRDLATDQESMFQQPDWVPYLERYQARSVTVLERGYPMVEDVVFIRHPNFWTDMNQHGKLVESGQCYWLSVALLIYGDASYWLRVKAEHLSFLERVLADPAHPRHAFYSRENQTSSQTQATGPGDGIWAGTINLWERLQIPGCWVGHDMCGLTADVYGIFVVLYKYNSRSRAEWKGKVYDMKTYGAYNNRHIFMCYAMENHFQPMVPNEYYAHEFKLPRLTLQATKKYRLVTREHRRLVHDGPGHHWRGPAQTIPAPLSWPSFTQEQLRRAAGYGPFPEQPDPKGKGKAVAVSNPTGASASPRRSNITQADALAAREALSLLRRFVDDAMAGRHPLPSAAPAQKRPAPDEPVGAQPMAKRLRTPPRPALPAASASGFTPVNRPRPGPHARGPSAAGHSPLGHPPSGSRSSREGHIRQEGISDREQRGFPPPRPQPRREVIELSASPSPVPPAPRSTKHGGQRDEELVSISSSSHSDAAPAAPAAPADPANPGPEPANPEPANPQPANPAPIPVPDPHPDETFFRRATKYLLTRVRLARLKKWCLDLELGAGDEVARWRKDQCVRALLDVRVEVRMTRARPRSGGAASSSSPSSSQRPAASGSGSGSGAGPGAGPGPGAGAGSGGCMVVDEEWEAEGHGEVVREPLDGGSEGGDEGVEEVLEVVSPGS